MDFKRDSKSELQTDPDGNRFKHRALSNNETASENWELGFSQRTLNWVSMSNSEVRDETDENNFMFGWPHISLRSTPLSCKKKKKKTNL